MFGRVSPGKEKYGKTRFFEIAGIIPRPANIKTPNINRRTLRTPPINRRRLRNLTSVSQGKQVIPRKPGEEVTVSGKWMIKDVSDISRPTEAAYDWISDGGYTNGQYTDNISGTGEMWMEITKQNLNAFATIEVDGLEVLADRVHLIVHADNSDEPWIRYNTPRVPGAYTFKMFARQTGGEDECFDIWTESVK